MKKYLLMIVSLLLISSSVSAAKYKPPPITEETINGVWEAIGVDHGSVRYFVMKIDTKGSSMLVEGTDFNVSFVSPLKSINVTDGKVHLAFASQLKAVGGRYQKDGIIHQITGVERIDGSGFADSDNGTMEVEFAIELESIWKLSFIKSKDSTWSLSERIRRNSQTAFEALKNGKGKFDK
jgi:hypothetical protein